MTPSTSATRPPAITVTVTLPSGPLSIWSNSVTPSIPDSGPDNPVELGVKFSSDISGYITGIRFYKSSANTGTHVGNLWSSTGTLLDTATFTQRDRLGLAAGQLRHPGADHGRYHLRRFLSHECGA